MPIMNGECPIDEEDVVTHDQVSDQASALSVDEASDGQGHVTVEQGKEVVRPAADPGHKTISLEAALPPAVSLGGTTVSTSATSSSGATASDGCKLFVGALPYFMTEQELYPLFAKFGIVKELSVQRDKLGRSRGCAWLRYSSVTECEACIRGLHNHYWLGSMKRPLQVQFASPTHNSPVAVACDGPQEQQQNSHHPDGKDDELGIPPKKRVFVGGLPKDVDEHDLLSMIEPVQGDVVCDVKVVRKNGNSDGAAFVEFITPEQAQEFMKMYGSGQQANLRGRPIVLRLDWPKPQAPPAHSSAKGGAPETKEHGRSRSMDTVKATADRSPIASTSASQSPKKDERSLASISAAVAAATVAAMESSGHMSEANLASIIAAATAAAAATAKQRVASATASDTTRNDTRMSRSQAKMSSTMGTAGALRLGRTGNSAEGDSIPLDSTGRPSRQIPWDDGRDGMNLMGMAGEDGPSRTLFISGLPTSFFLEDVVAMFKLFGPMRDVQLVSFPPGCAVVTFDSEQDAERARLTCDNFTFEQTGRRLSVRPMAVDSPDSYEMLNRGSSARQYTHRKENPSCFGGRRMRRHPEETSLLVFRVPSTTDETEIAGVFSEFGHVNSAHIISSRSLGIVSFNTMEEAVNAMTTVNLRMSSGDDRVPIHWLASGVHVELDSPVQDDVDTTHASYWGYQQQSSSLGRSQPSGQRQPLVQSSTTTSDNDPSMYWKAAGAATMAPHRDSFSS